jgi:replicative DNA helicase
MQTKVRDKQRGNGNGESISLADRLPPFNLEAEQGVLGSILLDNEILHDIIPILNVDDFFRDSHQIIYRAIRSLYDQAKPIDWIILEDELRRSDEIRKIGGADKLHEIIAGVPHAAHGRYYAQVVHEKAVARELIAAANEILYDGYSNAFAAEDLLASAVQRVSAISSDQGTTAKSMPTLRDGLRDRMAATRAGKAIGRLTGHPDLDDMLLGLKGGHLIILAARPSMGKTALALTIAANNAFEIVDRGEILQPPGEVYFVSMEMDDSELFERLAVTRSGIDGRKVAKAKFDSPSEEQAVYHAADELALAPIEISDAGSITVEHIAAVARKKKAAHKCDLIIVDYIQLISESTETGRKQDSRQEHIAKVARKLKQLARDLEIPIIALSQLNREAEKREDHRPRMSDLRESGAIEQDADIVLLMYRPDYYDANESPGKVELIIGKNRGGATGVVTLKFTPTQGRFSPWDDRQWDQAASFGDVDDRGSF